MQILERYFQQLKEDARRTHSCLNGKPNLNGARTEPWGFVYFIKGSEAGLVKIGFTTNLRVRFKALQLAAANPLETIGCTPAQMFSEAAIHTKFHKYRVRGEWFKLSTEILEFINTHQINSAWDIKTGIPIDWVSNFGRPRPLYEWEKD